MDGDRPLADRRDIFKSRVQEIIHDAWWGGWWDNQSERRFGEWPPEKRKERVKTYLEMFDFALSYLDGPTGDVGAQDEASEAREVGDDVRSKTDMRFPGFKPTVFDDITDDFTKKLSMRSPHGGAIKLIGHCKLEKIPDGSIRATIEYF